MSLVGVDAEPRAYAGKPWHLVRYWYARGGRGFWMPPMVTVLDKDGASVKARQHIAFETHIPLFGQLDDYMEARNIEDLGLYVIRDDMHLVIPSNLPPGKYTVTNAMAKPRLMSLTLDPGRPDELLSHEEVIATVEVVAGPPDAGDPLALGGNGRCK